MLSLRLCGRLIRASPTGSIACQAQFIQIFTFNVKRRGYVVPTIYLQQRRNDSEINLNENYKDHLNNNINKHKNAFMINNLRTYIELLKINLKDMKVDYDNLLETLNIFAELDAKIDDSIGIFLLYCCGEVLPDVDLEMRQALVHRFWDLLEKKNCSFSLDHYHIFLNVCAHNFENIDPKEFIEHMKVEPNKDTYLSLLNVAASTGNLDGVNFIMVKIKELKYPMNSEIINALIKFYSMRNDMKSAKSILNDEIELDTALQDEIYGNLVCGYAQQGDIDNVIQLLDKYSLSTKQLLQIIRNLSLANEGKNITKIFQYISVKETVTDPFLINVIVELTYLNKIDDSLLIIEFLSTNSLSSDTMNVSKYFLQTLARSKTSTPTILNISKKFHEKYGFLTVVLELLQGALSSNKMDLSFTLLEEMTKKNVEIRPHFYWPLLIRTSKEKGETGVLDVIDHLIKMGVQLDYATLFYYVIPYISTLDPMGTFRKLTEHGLPAYSVVTPLVKYYLENGQIEKAHILCNKMHKMTDCDEILPSFVKAYEINRNNIDTIIKILTLFDKNKDYFGKFLFKIVNHKLFRRNVDIFEELLNIYEKHKISISSFSAITIEDYAYGINTVKIAVLLRKSNIINDEDEPPVTNAERISGMVHPKDMNKEQLACHLIELQSKGFNFRGLLRKLFIVHCKNNDLKKVEEIKAKIDKNDIQLTPGMKSNLLGVYARNGKAIDAYSIILDLRTNEPNWKIDPPKILNTATALVDQNEIEKALNIVYETKIVSHESPNECWKLLNAIAHSEKPELVEPMLNKLLRKGFCDIDNKLLGPLIRLHLLKNDLPSAVEAFINVAKKYVKTPLRQELIGILVEAWKNSLKESIGNNELMLDRVVDAASLIHGRDVVNTDLLIAYAQFEMLGLLKILLQKLRPNSVDFNKIVGGMKDDVKQKVLLTIFDVSRNINTINRLSICDSLLSSYSNTGNIQDALNLWQRMEDEDIDPSRSLQMKFSTLLDVHKKSI